MLCWYLCEWLMDLLHSFILSFIMYHTLPVYMCTKINYVQSPGMGLYNILQYTHVIAASIRCKIIYDGMRDVINLPFMWAGHVLKTMRVGALISHVRAEMCVCWSPIIGTWKHVFVCFSWKAVPHLQNSLLQFIFYWSAYFAKEMYCPAACSDSLFDSVREMKEFLCRLAIFYFILSNPKLASRVRESFWWITLVKDKNKWIIIRFRTNSNICQTPSS